MSFDYLIRLKAGPILSYEKGKWSVVTGYGDFDNDSSNETDVRNISLGLNTYKWTVTNGDGICTLEDLVNVNIMSLVIPQGISPNGDLVNDSLVINGLDLVNQIAELSIVNGAGTQVFSTSNRNGGKWQNWDGKNSQGAELPEGTYYYMLKVTSPKTEITVPKSGFIILRRK
jgi:gliding motility-associated-like protein